MSTVSTPLPFTPAQMNSADTTQWKILRAELDDLRCATPAFLVKDVNPDAQTVSVQIAIQERVRTVKGAQWWDVPPINNVPIVVPRGGGYSVTLPLKKGDEGLLIFCDTCFDNWWAHGQTGPKAANVKDSSGSQPQLEVRRHDVTDCGFIPGMWSQKSLLKNYSNSSMQLRRDDGSAIVDIAQGLVSILAQNGTAQPLVNDTFFQWFVTSVLPFLVSKGYAGPDIPPGSETTILKGQ